MSTYYPNAQFTLLERAKRTEDGKRILPVLDVMDQMGTQNFLKVVPYFPANRGLVHTHRRTTSRPNPTRRLFYQGVTSRALTTEVIAEPMFLFEARTEIDEDEVDTVDNGNEIRSQEDGAASGGCVDSFVNAIFNDDRSSGGQYINGLKSRMNSISHPGNSSSSTLPFVWDNGGTSSTLSSIYIVEFGPRSCFAIYPGGGAAAGTTMGVVARNKGKEKCFQSTSFEAYYAYVTQLKKWCGLVVRDDRKVARIANVETNTSGSNRFDEDILIRALHHGRFDARRTVLFANPYVGADFDIRAKDKSNHLWSTEEIFGTKMTTFRGMPFIEIDESIITATESQVT